VENSSSERKLPEILFVTCVLLIWHTTNAAHQCSQAAEKFYQVSSFMAAGKWMGNIHWSYLNFSIWLAHLLLVGFDIKEYMQIHAVVNRGSLAMLT